MTIVLIYPEREKMLAVVFIDGHAGGKELE